MTYFLITIRRISWFSFWCETILGIVTTIILLFTNDVNNSQGQLGLTSGLGFTTISLIVLLPSLWYKLLVINITKQNLNKIKLLKDVIKKNIVISLLGILFGLIGYLAIMSVLFIQASSQTTGQLITATSDIPITGLEILCILSNTTIIAAHFFTLTFSLNNLTIINKNIS